MGGKDNGINFNQKFLTYLPENIKLSDLMTEKEGAKSKLKNGLGNIFNHFDTINKDGELDADEVNVIIRTFDTDKNKKVTDDEIKAYCEANGIDKKMAKQLVERINNNLLSATGKTRINNIPKGSFTYVGSKTWYNIDKTQYGENYIQYDSTIDEDARKEKVVRSAIYDIKNDAFRSANGNSDVEIVGVKAFQNAAFKDGKIKKLNNEFDSYPKILLTNKDGTKTEIELRVQDVGASIIEDEEEYMMILTNITSALSSLSLEVLDDLKNNVKYIGVNYLDYNAAGQAFSNGDLLENYNEYIKLDVPLGIMNIESTLVHEVAHTVDDGIGDFATKQYEEKISEFISNLTKSDIPYKLKGAYALKNPQELYAEYYTHLHTGGKSHLKEDVQLFNLLERSLQKDDSYGWGEIKKILDGVRDKSIGLTNEYASQAQADIDYFTALNNQKGSISEERVNKVDLQSLWDNFNTMDMRTKFSDVLKNYKEYFIKFTSGSIEEQLEIVKLMRNHPDFKADFEQLLISSEKQVQERNRRDNLTFNDALVESEAMFNKNQRQRLDKTKLLEKINAKGSGELEDLLNSPGLRDAIIAACETDRSIPKVIREKYKDGTTEPVTLDTLLAFRNEPNVWSYLVVDRAYFRSQKVVR